jgi:D-alanyl-D-alanine endopeptidase (penicillin-binding protein 7)
MVVLDAGSGRRERWRSTMDDFDYLKGSHSRLRMGATLSRDEMLRLALMASENRAASALVPPLSRAGRAFRRGDEREGAALGMTSTHLRGSHGPSAAQRVDGNDLARSCARGRVSADPRVLDDPAHYVEVQGTGQLLGFNNSNGLVKNTRGISSCKRRAISAKRPLCRHAGDDRQPADGDRVARFAWQVFADG